jgi:hypothetical protein
MSESLLNESPQPAEATAEVTQAQTDRPDWLPEKFNSPEDLGKAYNELSSKLGAKEEDLKASWQEEMQREAYADRPATKGDYLLPESIDPETAVDSPLLDWWSDHSFESGLGQEEFQKGIELFAEAMNAGQPDMEAETKLLGDSATDRIEAASLFANQFFPEESLDAIERMCETAGGIVALEHIMEKMKGPSFAGDSTMSSQITEDSLRSMQNDERYWNPQKRDNAYVSQVDQAYRKLYG